MPEKTKYDIVIIGGGLGGLFCAVILGKEGRKVAVLEQDKQAGGCLQTFSFRKKVFDSCVHYIGGLGDGHSLNRIFRYAGIMDELKLKSLDSDCFDEIFLPGKSQSFSLANGTENFIEKLLARFPDDVKDLRHYVEFLRETSAKFPLYNLRNGSNDEKETVVHLALEDVLNDIFSNPEIPQVLLGNSLLYAGQQGKTPWYLHALVMESYIHSAHKVQPGSSAITKLLCREISKHGGEVFRNTEVVKLEETDGKLSAAIAKTGQRFEGEIFIGATSPKVLLPMIPQHLLRPAYTKRLMNIPQTISSFMVNAVLQPKTFPYPKSNIYYNSLPGGFLPENGSLKNGNSFAVFCTEDAANPGFADTASILTYMDFSEVAGWANSINRSNEIASRGGNYDAWKAEKAQELIALVASTTLPNLPAAIIAQKIATPLTWRDYTATPEGSLYGNAKDVTQPANTAVPVRTRIPNLFLTGQNVNLHGVLGVSITALATCGEIIGLEYLLAKINA